SDVCSSDLVRSDFTETLYWHPVLVLADGSADAAFSLSDSVTTFQVLAAGNTLDGRLGSGSVELESRLPFTIEPKLPVEVSSTDLVDAPLAIANNTSSSIPVQIAVASKGLASTAISDDRASVLAPNARARPPSPL